MGQTHFIRAFSSTSGSALFVWLKDRRKKVPMRKLKGIRKLKSIHNRAATLKHMVGVFQKAYTKAQGDPKQRFEEACRHTDEVIKQLVYAEPQKKSFYMVVVDDFKKYLIDCVENEELIAKAVAAAKPAETVSV